jgi:hypothetical protein
MVGTQDWNSVPNDQSRVRIELSILGSRDEKAAAAHNPDVISLY